MHQQLTARLAQKSLHWVINGSSHWSSCCNTFWLNSFAGVRSKNPSLKYPSLCFVLLYISHYLIFQVVVLFQDHPWCLSCCPSHSSTSARSSKGLAQIWVTRCDIGWLTCAHRSGSHWALKRSFAMTLVTFPSHYISFRSDILQPWWWRQLS